MSDEEIASIKESTFGVSELLQEAETFVGARQERELMRARERYWHDQNSLRGDYEEQTRVRDAKILTMESETRSMTSGKLKSERRSIAQMLRIRFGAPIRTLIARLNRIDSSETLDQLSDYSVVRKDYDAFLEDLSSCDKQEV